MLCFTIIPTNKHPTITLPILVLKIDSKKYFANTIAKPPIRATLIARGIGNKEFIDCIDVDKISDKSRLNRYHLTKI